jgi:protein-S-isoprenylcysteine O-methyltransferase Ste14
VPEGLAQILAGWVYILAASVLLLWCFWLFISNRTTIMPRNPVNQLVIRGPYRISRNPMYLSLALFHLGIGIATGNIWHIVTFAPSMLAIRLWVIAPEERYMSLQFGNEYRDYCAKVPRWF